MLLMDLKSKWNFYIFFGKFSLVKQLNEMMDKENFPLNYANKKRSNWYNFNNKKRLTCTN